MIFDDRLIRYTQNSVAYWFMSLNDHFIAEPRDAKILWAYFSSKNNVPSDMYNYISISISVHSHVGSFYFVLLVYTWKWTKKDEIM